MNSQLGNTINNATTSGIDTRVCTIINYIFLQIVENMIRRECRDLDYLNAYTPLFNPLQIIISETYE